MTQLVMELKSAVRTCKIHKTLRVRRHPVITHQSVGDAPTREGIQTASTLELSAHELQGDNSLYGKSHEDILNKIFATSYWVDRFANIYVQCEPIRLCIVEVRCELGWGICIC